MHVFILSYSGIHLLNRWFKPQDFKNTKLYIVDNGDQKLPETLLLNKITTTKNIGCAGGWNLICDIAFKYLKLDKIVITQDDVNFTEQDIINCYNQTNNKMLTGLFQPYFEFSFFCITKEIYNKIGRFDENFLYVYSEDADYKYRCFLNGVLINSLLENCEGRNKSWVITNEPWLNKMDYNREYLFNKWGFNNSGQSPFVYKYPFNDSKNNISDIQITDRLTNMYGNISEFPSQTEFKHFLNDTIKN